MSQGIRYRRAMLKKGQLLRMLRTTQGIQQQDAAKRAKMSPAYLSLIEHGKKQPGDDVLSRLARLYKVPAYLFNWNEGDVDRAASEEERQLLRKMDDLVRQLYFLVTNRK